MLRPRTLLGMGFLLTLVVHVGLHRLHRSGASNATASTAQRATSSYTAKLVKLQATGAAFPKGKAVQEKMFKAFQRDVAVNQHRNADIPARSKGAMRVMHNRSLYIDKQIIRLQEAPEHMPQGETPQTVSMCTWARLVDVCKPGDRVEVTGVYCASPVRSNPRHRSASSTCRACLAAFPEPSRSRLGVVSP